MTPLHPKLRRSLLEDSEHKKTGLTPEMLDSYEAMLAQYFYSANYPDNKKNAQRENLYNRIVQFQASYLPNWTVTQAAWLRERKKIVRSNFGGIELQRRIVGKLWRVGRNIQRLGTGWLRKEKQPEKVVTTHRNEQKE
jgi:hypothetical protein